MTTRLRGMNPTNSIVYSPNPRAEVYCLRLNINISKLAYSNQNSPIRSMVQQHKSVKFCGNTMKLIKFDTRMRLEFSRNV